MDEGTRVWWLLNDMIGGCQIIETYNGKDYSDEISALNRAAKRFKYK